jgi:hypothetical protein
MSSIEHIGTALNMAHVNGPMNELFQPGESLLCAIKGGREFPSMVGNVSKNCTMLVSNQRVIFVFGKLAGGFDVEVHPHAHITQAKYGDGVVLARIDFVIDGTISSLTRVVKPDARKAAEIINRYLQSPAPGSGIGFPNVTIAAPAVPARYCGKCGAELVPGGTFCIECGERL